MAHSKRGAQTPLTAREARVISNHEKSCLSSGDAVFLYLEREGTPLNVASVCIFDGIIPLEACSDFVNSKLPLIPRYRQRVMMPPFNIGLPTWEYDPEFDMRNHMREVSLRKGTVAELKMVAGRILSANMDRRRPLWDFTLVRGLKENRTAIVFRVHHCLVDGIAGVALMNVLMDPSPVPPAPPRKQEFATQPARDPLTSLLDQLITASFSNVQRLLRAQSELLTLAQQVVGALGKRTDGAEALSASSGDGQAKLLADFLKIVSELAAPAERLPFNVICRGPQKFRWTEVPMAQIKAVRQACGATVNDVVLTIVTAAFRRYAQLHGVPLDGRLLRIVVPINARGNGDASEMGNRITFVPVTVPLDVRDPRKLIAAVHQRMEFLKKARLAELVRLAGSLLGAIPPALQAILGPIASQLPLTLCNLICTNVPGPQVPLYLLGHRLLQCYPYVPIGGEMGINCAVLSYDGVAYFGFTGDAHAAPDLARLEGFLDNSFLELRKAAGIRMSRQKRTPNNKSSVVVRASEPSPASDEHVSASAPVPFPSPAAEQEVAKEGEEFRAAVSA